MSLTQKRYRDIRRSNCSRKIRYESEEEANVQLLDIPNAVAEGMHAYRCDWCTSYHVGHPYIPTYRLEDDCRD